MINDPLTTRQREGESKSSVILLRRECFEKMLFNLTNTYGAPGYSMIFSMGKNVGQEEFKSIAEDQKQLDIPFNKRGFDP